MIEKYVYGAHVSEYQGHLQLNTTTPLYYGSIQLLF